jgi:transposase
MYITVAERKGKILVQRNLRCDRRRFLLLIQPYRKSLAVAAEATSSWYWLADLCQAEGIEFVLGHALYMKAIHGAKTKSDRLDSEKIARLTQSGLLPVAYTYPKKFRALRDLLRRRTRFVRLRAELYTHIHILNHQANLAPLGHDAKVKCRRTTVVDHFDEQEVRLNVEADLALIGHYDQVIAALEKHILKRAKSCHPRTLRILLSVPGIGTITALTIAFEVDTIDRFTTRQQFASYCRLVKCTKESAGKKLGTSGAKIGNAYLKWAFSEAAVHAAEYSPTIKRCLERMEHKHGKGKAKSLLAHKLGRAVYYMLKRKTVFDEELFTKA